jgi:hypothetical protein
MYKDYVGPNNRMLDEDVDDIAAVQQQIEALRRLVNRLKMNSVAGKKWQEEIYDLLEVALHDSSTEWLVEKGRDLTAIREPF